MWAYGRTFVQEKQRCLQTKRRLNVWELKSEGRDRAEEYRYRYFYLSEAREVLLQSGSISFSLAFIYITFRLCGGYMLHTKKQIQTDALTQGNKIQSQLFASCPTENNHANSFWSRSFVYCMCPPLEDDLLLYCFSPQFMVIYKALLHLSFTPAVISGTCKFSSYLDWKSKKSQTTRCPAVPVIILHTIHRTSLWANLHVCISLFPHLYLFVCEESFFVTRW